MAFKPSNAFLLVIIAMIFGAVSGILSVVIIGAGNFKLPFLGQINYTGSNLDDKIVIEQPRSVVVEQDTQMRQVENDLLPAIVDIYRAKSNTDPLAAAYADKEVLGRGFVLTADGWVVSVASALDNPKGKYSAIGYQSKKYDLSGLIEDKASGIVFAKMPGANLPVARLGKSGDLHLGQTVIIAAGRNQLALSHISKIGYDFPRSQDLVLGADRFEKRLHFSDAIDKSYEGAPVVNFKGEVIAVISGGVGIPVDYFSGLVSDILKTQKIVRASLGVDYIDLAQAAGLINLGDKGAYVAYEPLKGSAVYGLVRKGDIIRKFNDVELNAFSGLSDVLNGYKPADKAELIVLRSGKEMSFTVTLK